MHNNERAGWVMNTHQDHGKECEGNEVKKSDGVPSRHLVGLEEIDFVDVWWQERSRGIGVLGRGGPPQI